MKTFLLIFAALFTCAGLAALLGGVFNWYCVIYSRRNIGLLPDLGEQGVRVLNIVGGALVVALVAWLTIRYLLPMP
ncbi:MAG TPA: hypothetical protein VD997_07810 [Phycisphaerales bacterium]|nr:hypothetical protein [Phycisphaerales bacterium]